MTLRHSSPLSSPRVTFRQQAQLTHFRLQLSVRKSSATSGRTGSPGAMCSLIASWVKNRARRTLSPHPATADRRGEVMACLPLALARRQCPAESMVRPWPHQPRLSSPELGKLATPSARATSGRGRPHGPVQSVRHRLFTDHPYGSDMLRDVREYIDRLHIDGHSIGEDHDDDPVLLDPDGRAVDTWRENYPYDERMPREDYDEQKYLLQVELLKFQNWATENETKHVLLFEGRDAAGKGGTIKRFMEHLNPRYARTVALGKPSDREQTQWYYQRYVKHLPAAGEMVLFDRSWYNRAGVERVMGFASPPDYEQFMAQTPLFERMLVDSGISLTKFWFSVTQAEQRTRFIIRQVDPVRQWKLSPIDLESLDKWDDYIGGQGGDDPSYRHRVGAVDDGEEQRQEAGPGQRDARLPQPVRLRRQGHRHRRRARPEDRPARHRRGRRLAIPIRGGAGRATGWRRVRC